MKAKRILSLIAAAIIVICAIPFSVNAAEGTEISNADELLALMKDSTKWAGSYYLTADIDLSAKSGQSPIGNKETPFTGTFDGNGKTISGLFLTGEKYQALFGCAENVTIKNLQVRQRTFRFRLQWYPQPYP